jgi:hypothetical protein
MFVVIGNIFSVLVCLDQEKSGNPGWLRAYPGRKLLQYWPRPFSDPAKIMWHSFPPERAAIKSAAAFQNLLPPINKALKTKFSVFISTSTRVTRWGEFFSLHCLLFPTFFKNK